MQAVFLMAGKGSRMAKHLAGPKQLMDVGGKPVIEHTLDNLPHAVTSLIFVVGGPHEEALRAHFSRSEHGGRPITFVQQPEPRGTADAFWCAHDSITGPFLGLLSDEIVGKETLHRLASEDGHAILTRKVPNPENFGVVLTDEKGYVRDFLEKPKEFISDLVWAGGMRTDASFLSTRVPESPRGEFEVPAVILELMKRGKPFRTVMTDEWHTVNDVHELNEARKRFGANAA
jgi:dTDP-glucose pyrophosphorylase